MSNDTRIAVDMAKAVFEIAISDRPGHVTRREPHFAAFEAAVTDCSAAFL